jgi:hypothetical protein
MSSVAIQGNASGAGVFTIASPNSASSYTATLPTATTTLVGTDATQTLTNKTLTSPTMTTPVINSATVSTVSGTAPLYMCRAWVVFTGSTGATLGSGNVSSVTRSSAGQYVVNFTTAMPDANYTAVSNVGNSAGAAQVAGQSFAVAAPAVGSVAIYCCTTASGAADPNSSGQMHCAVFR